MAVEIKGVTTAPLTDTKVGTTNPTPINNSNPNSGSVDTTGSSTASADKLSLTRRAEEMHMLEKNINSQPDIDTNRVEDLKLQIDSGRYDIDAQRVAEKLIAFETQFVA